MFNTILATAAKAAPAAQNAGQQTQTNPMGMLILMTGAFILMFWMMSRSNKKQQQKREQLLDSIVKGTEVMLASGIYGKVSAVQDKILTVEIADRVFVKVNRAGIHDVILPQTENAAPAEEKKEEKSDK
ncbi:MAG: preprotein translocase subunit YajC [Lentisphaeria bacterium]|nr:preprotein translocase subunit YajC [Lentisphaeria bacterium]